MKLLLVLAAVALFLWLLRGRNRNDQGPTRRGTGPSAKPAPDAAPMLQCAHCGVHLPRDEALPGRGGAFCDAAHRAAFERTHPGP
jgi:uncharacterized protein